MKFLLILTSYGLFWAGRITQIECRVYNSDWKSITSVKRIIDLHCAPGLSLRTAADNNIFKGCANRTIDMFLGPVDETMEFEKHVQHFNQSHFTNLYRGLSKMFSDIYTCFDELNFAAFVLTTSFGLGVDSVKDQLPKAISLIYHTFCLPSEYPSIDLIQNNERLSCLDNLVYNALIDALTHETYLNILDRRGRGYVGTCQEFNDAMQQNYGQLIKCSPDISTMIKSELEVFCEVTDCKRNFPNSQCVI